MAKVQCQTCGRTFPVSSKKEAEGLLRKHCVHELIGEATSRARNVHPFGRGQGIP